VADPKRFRLRRTIAPAQPAPASLSRSLWGVATADAHVLLDQQQQEFAASDATLDAELQAERSRLRQLTAEVERHKRRLQSLRSIVEVLRGKLAHERAARAVLATRLLSRQAEEQKATQAAGTMRLESVRLSADIQQEHEALRQLVAALYRSVAGRQGVPAGLDLLAEIPAAPSRSGGPKPTAPWQRFLLGKKAGHLLQTADGRVILQEGETIGPDELEAAEHEGLLFELILTARVVERIPDL